MKGFVRNTLLRAFALFLLQGIMPAVHVAGGIPTYLVGGLVLVLLELILRPVLNILTLPLRILTFGASSFIIYVIILYIVTVIVTKITITAFVFERATLAGFIIPTMSFNTLFAYMLSALALTLIIKGIEWVIE